MLLADFMLFSGTFCPLNRHGLNKLDVGPLTKCVFEETSDVLFNAALFAEKQVVESIADNIMFGQHFNAGTGSNSFQLIGDENYLKRAVDKQASASKTEITRTFYSNFANTCEDDSNKPNLQCLSPVYIPEDENYEPTATSPRCFKTNASSPIYCPSPLQKKLVFDELLEPSEEIFQYKPSTPKLPSVMSYEPSSPLVHKQENKLVRNIFPKEVQALYDETSGELKQNVLLNMIDSQ